MEGEKKAKLFVCKFCFKRYPCGKSLGGHIRTHTINSSAHYQHRQVVAEEEEENSRAINKVVNLHCLAGGKKSRTGTTTTTTDHHGDSNVSAYILRENPKKTRRFSTDYPSSKCLNFQQDQKVICKECGKGFQSLKALCGHMACHSHEKEKGVVLVHVNNNMVEENLSSSTDQYRHNHNQKKMQIVMDIQSESETWISKGAGVRYDEKTSCLDNDFAYGSSSLSNIEQEEQDVVMCLMMLSRDQSSSNNYCKWGLNSVTESSETNSVVLETKSSSTDHHNQIRRTAKEKISILKEKISTPNYTNGEGGLEEEVKNKGKLKADNFSDFYQNSDSGYVQNGSKFDEFDVSKNGFHKFHEFKKLRVKCGSGFVANEAKLESELEEQVKNRSCSSSKYELRNRAKSINAPNGIEFPQSSVKKMKMMTIITDPSGDNIYGSVTEKGQKYKCLTCNKMFASHRALGGHKLSHRRINGWDESTDDGGEHSIETINVRPVDYHNVPESELNVIDSFSAKNVIIERKLGSKKKAKRYKCPICFKVYRSGQALGGHKKSHFVGGSDQANKKIVMVKEEEEEKETKGVRGFIDLNLPATLEDDDDEEEEDRHSDQFMGRSW